MDPHDAADRIELAVIRGLLATDTVEPLTRAEVYTLLLERLLRRRAREIDTAYQTGATHAAVGRALHISRQAARERHQRTHGQRAAGLHGAGARPR